MKRWLRRKIREWAPTLKKAWGIAFIIVAQLTEFNRFLLELVFGEVQMLHLAILWLAEFFVGLFVIWLVKTAWWFMKERPDRANFGTRYERKRAELIDAHIRRLGFRYRSEYVRSLIERDMGDVPTTRISYSKVR